MVAAEPVEEKALAPEGRLNKAAVGMHLQCSERAGVFEIPALVVTGSETWLRFDLKSRGESLSPYLHIPSES